MWLCVMMTEAKVRLRSVRRSVAIGTEALRAYASASANTAWIFSSAVRIFTRCFSAPFTAARMPSSPAVANVVALALGAFVAVAFAGRPGPRFFGPFIFALTL